MTESVDPKEIRDWLLWLFDNPEKADDDDLEIMFAISNHPDWPWRLSDKRLTEMADSIRQNADKPFVTPNKPLDSPDFVSSTDYAMALDDDDETTGKETQGPVTLLSLTLDPGDSRVSSLPGHSGALKGELFVELVWNSETCELTVTTGRSLVPGSAVLRKLRWASSRDALRTAVDLAATDRFSPSWLVKLETGRPPRRGEFVQIEYENKSQGIHVAVTSSIE